MENGNDKKLNLAEEFPAVPTRDWEEKIREDLGGADYEKSLVWETHDRYHVRPYYRREDLGGIEYLASLPGQFPYLRGSRTIDNSWLVRQDIPVGNPESGNRQALEILEKGVTSIGFDLRAAGELKEKDIHTLLEALPLEKTPVNFILDRNYLDILGWFHSFVQKNGPDPEKATGSISLDPLGWLAATGNYQADMASDLSGLRDCLAFARDHLPGFRVIHNCGNLIHDAGATVSQQLAFTLAKGNEYLVRLSEMGLPLESILAHMQFQFSVGSSYFMEIAKLRAARYLWSRILEAHSPSAEDLPAMFLLSMTSRWRQTLYDAHVNLLRGTTSAMSAILGGADSLTVTAFDLPLRDPGPFSERLARNTQIILKEESYLDKVIDPAAGSYYIENLTDTLITGAWDLFLQTEEKGGYLESLAKGFIQDSVKNTALSRRGNFAIRRETLLGTNQYPILDEQAGSFANLRQEAAGAEKNQIGKIAKSPGILSGDQPIIGHPKSPEPLPADQRIVEPLESFRGAREFEELRLKTENHPGRQPVVFIVPLGNLAMRRARAMFTMNFFGCSGFQVIDNIGKFTNVRQGMDAARKAGADIVVLCSSDEEYPSMAADLVSLSRGQSKTADSSTALQAGTKKSAGHKAGSPSRGKAMIPVIAGYPQKHLDALQKAGAEHFIHARSNVLEELKHYQELLGI